jgi:pimeloyl-ACP methyl ester carboxylesterase
MDWDGTAVAPPVLFLHAFTGNGLAAFPLARLIGGRRRLIAPDLRGRGHSDMPVSEYGVPMHITDVLGLLDSLYLEKVVVAGHSFGAAIGVHLAAKYPDRVAGLTLFDGGAVPSEAAATVLDAYYGSLQYRYSSMDQYVDRFRTAPLYQPWTGELEALVRSNLTLQPDGTYMRRVPRYVIDADRRNQNGTAWTQLPDLYPQIRCPVLIVRAGHGVFGREDQVLPDDVITVMKAGMPAAEVFTVDSAGHTSLLTIPHEGRDHALIRFLGLADGA